MSVSCRVALASWLGASSLSSSAAPCDGGAGQIQPRWLTPLLFALKKRLALAPSPSSPPLPPSLLSSCSPTVDVMMLSWCVCVCVGWLKTHVRMHEVCVHVLAIIDRSIDRSKKKERQKEREKELESEHIDTRRGIIIVGNRDKY